MLLTINFQHCDLATNPNKNFKIRLKELKMSVGQSVGFTE